MRRLLLVTAIVSAWAFAGGIHAQQAPPGYRNVWYDASTHLYHTTRCRDVETRRMVLTTIAKLPDGTTLCDVCRVAPPMSATIPAPPPPPTPVPAPTPEVVPRQTTHKWLELLAAGIHGAAVGSRRWQQYAAPEPYLGFSGSHWIDVVSSYGSVVVLEDESAWGIDPLQQITTMLWLPAQRVAVVASDDWQFPVLLVNRGNSQTVKAVRLRTP